MRVGDYEKLKNRYKLYFTGIAICTLGVSAIPTMLFSIWLAGILNISSVGPVNEQEGGLLWVTGFLLVGAVNLLVMTIIVFILIRRYKGWTYEQALDYIVYYKNFPKHWLHNTPKKISVFMQLFETEMSEKYSRLFSFFMAIFVFTLLGIAITSGEHYFTNSSNVVSRSENPSSFWSIAIAQAFVGIIAFTIAFPKIQTLVSPVRKKRKRVTVNSVIVEIEVLISYGRKKKAFEMTNALLKKYPNNKKLLELKEIITKK